MIFLNGDAVDIRNFRKYLLVPYKGNISDSLLVIEDVFDFSKPNPDKHLCLCKCLRCGKVLPKLLTVRMIREKRGRCPCSDPRYKFFDKKGEMLKFLIAERNKVKREAVFAEDEERVQKYDFIIQFLQSKSLRNYFNKKLDL